MADNVIDTLSLEISSDAGKAVDSLDRLASSLTKIKNSLGGGWIGNIKELSTNIHSLSGSTKKLDTGRLTGFASALGKLSGSVTALAAVSGDLTPAINNLGKLAAFDFSKLKVSGDFSGLGTLAQGMEQLADVAPKVATLKASEINKTLKSFGKIGNADFSGIVQSLQALNGLDVTGFTALTQSMSGFADSVGRLAQLKTADITRAVKAFERLSSLNISGLAASLQSLNGVDLAKISELGSALQGFITTLAGADKISAGTTKIFTALSQLAASANNIPAVIDTLQGLSAKLHGFISVMSSAPAVEAGTVSLVSALAMLANAGAKASKVAAAFPELTAGAQGFVQMLSSLPRLDNNILRAVEALAQLANAGGRAGSASRDLLNNINRLSGGMGSLRPSTLGAAGGLKSFAGQLLAALGITGGFYGLVRAIKASITAASDLSEAQNVIEQGFGNLIYKIEDFSETSIQAFGMSELAAKNTAGIYAVMGKSLGVLPDAATDMAVALTGLTGDLASFYNVSQDVANTALKSVFTGETESLKKFGIVTTQANLQAFALSQGITKSVKAMTQAELVTLRYNFVMDAASSAMGDFARTAGGSWANQIRIMTEQFKQLASIIGGGLMAVLLPVVKGINLVMSKIIQLATVLSSFLGKLFNIQKATTGSGAGLAGIADSAGMVADNTEAAAGGIADTGSAAKKAKKDLNGFAASWHEVTNMSSNESSETGGSGDAGSVSMPDMSLPSEYEMEITADDKVSSILEAIRKRFQELKELFIKGFYFGVGDLSVFDCIRQHLANIRESFLDIFTDDAVVSSFNNLLNTLAFNAGAKLGAFTSIGLTIADNLLGGIDLYLGKAKERIKNWLVHVFDLTGEIDTIKTNFIVSVAEIFTVFRGDEAKALTADVIRIFADAFMNVSELALKFGRDLLGLILSPITENASGFKTTLENTISPLETIMGSISNSFTSLWETVQSTYDEHMAPMFEAFTEGISQIVGSLLEGYNTHIAPVLSNLANKFTEVWEGTISPLLENFIGLFGDVADFVTAVWTNVFQPVINWIAIAIMPVVAPVLQALGDAFLVTFEAIGKLFDGFITAARGVLQFLTGVFSGDWQKAWTGVKTIFKGIWDMFPGFVKEPIRAIIGSVNKMIDAIQGGINYVIRGLNKLHFDVPDWVPGIGGESFGFSISEISLPRIPQLAQGGITTGATLALIGEAGREAILPLENNTGWIDSLSERISENLSKDFGNLQLDYSVPAIEEYSRQYSDSDMGRLKSTLQMEMDEKLAQAAYENQQLQQAVERNTQILEQILSQGIVLDDNTFTNKYKSASTKFYKQHRYEMGLYPAGR